MKSSKECSQGYCPQDQNQQTHQHADPQFHLLVCPRNEGHHNDGAEYQNVRECVVCRGVCVLACHTSLQSSEIRVAFSSRGKGEKRQGEQTKQSTKDGVNEESCWVQPQASHKDPARVEGPISQTTKHQKGDTDHQSQAHHQEEEYHKVRVAVIPERERERVRERRHATTIDIGHTHGGGGEGSTERNFQSGNLSHEEPIHGVAPTQPETTTGCGEAGVEKHSQWKNHF